VPECGAISEDRHGYLCAVNVTHVTGKNPERTGGGWLAALDDFRHWLIRGAA
jgi:hypothetical protein